MLILNTLDDIIKAISEAKLNPPNKLTSTKYNDNVTYECGCREFHRVNDPSNIIFAIAFPVKFVMDCKNGYVTFFQIKGFFKQKVTSFWTTKSKTFSNALEKLGIKF